MIGIFDSGMGGLSVLREVARILPKMPLCYLGDNLHIPYGLKTNDEIRAYSLGIVRYLTERQGCHAVVVACNTATAAAVEHLRETFPHLPIVGMEPGIKPAAALTRSGCIGVLATHSTLSANRLARLVERYAGGIEVITQPCPEWVELVEQGETNTPAACAAVARYVQPLIAHGADTLVLGCTHYPFLLPVIADVAGREVTIIDTGPAVARRVADVTRAEENSPVRANFPEPVIPAVRWFTTGTTEHFERVARFCLGIDVGQVTHLVWNKGELTENATN